MLSIHYKSFTSTIYIHKFLQFLKNGKSYTYPFLMQQIHLGQLGMIAHINNKS